MLLGSLADDEYWSEYGVLVVIDRPGSAYNSADYAGEDDLDPGLGLDADLLEVSGMQLRPGGTVAHAGTAWLWGRVGWIDSYHVVRLEAPDPIPHPGRPGGVFRVGRLQLADRRLGCRGRGAGAWLTGPVPGPGQLRTGLQRVGGTRPPSAAEDAAGVRPPGVQEGARGAGRARGRTGRERR